MADQHSTTTSDQYTFEKEHYNKPVGELLGFIDKGTGLGSYLEALATNDKEKLATSGDNVADTALAGLAAIGKLMVYADMTELKEQAADIGWLIVALSDLGMNAHSHANDAKYTQLRIKELHKMN